MLTSNLTVVTFVNDLLRQCHFTSYSISVSPDCCCLPCWRREDASPLPLQLVPNKSICSNVKFQAPLNFLLSYMAVFPLLFPSMNSGCCRVSVLSENNLLPAQTLGSLSHMCFSPRICYFELYPQMILFLLNLPEYSLTVQISVSTYLFIHTFIYM